MPSTYSVSNWRVFDSSTVMTPSRPTLSMTSALSLPISGSAAEFAAISPICCLPLTSTACFFSSSTRASTPFSRPRFRSIAFAPAAIWRMPSWTIACARTTEVVVPSPAMSFVLVAASLRSCAPMFSYGSWSSTSRATVTPSCVTVGAPNFLSSATLRPFGPSVVFTALAMMSTPALSDLRASSVNVSCFGMFSPSPLGLDEGEDVVLVHQQVLLVVDLELGPGVLLVEDAVAELQRHLDLVAVLVQPARADRDDRALLGLLLRRLRQDDPALRHLLALQRLDDDPGAQRPQLGERLGLVRDCCCHVRALPPTCLHPNLVAGQAHPGLDRPKGVLALAPRDC